MENEKLEKPDEIKEFFLNLIADLIVGIAKSVEKSLAGDEEDCCKKFCKKYCDDDD